MFTTAITAIAADGGGFAAAGFGVLLFILVPLFWFGLFALIAGIAGRRWRRAAMAGGMGRGPWGHHGYGYAKWSPTRSAEQTLAARFANGDIDEQEYRARLEVIRATAYPGPAAE